MNPEPPAGYFSTFSLLDPSRSTNEGLVKPQRRNRRVFVCIPCHRRKLKCDKGQPCLRCSQSGVPEECVYQQRSSTPRQQADDDSEDASQPARSSAPPVSAVTSSASVGSVATALSVDDDGELRLTGATHYSAIASQFREGWPYISGTEPKWEPRFRHIQGYEYLFNSLSDPSFPFGFQCAYSHSRTQTLEELPPRQLTDAIIQCYLGSFEPIYRLVHPQQFREEVNTFWVNHSQCSDAWLAQYFMVLALGCQTVPDHLLSSTARHREEWTDRFLDAAQFFFGRSSYFVTPTLTSMRTLCMAAIAHLMGLVKGAATSQMVSLMGFVSRAAMTIQLHRTADATLGLWPFEVEMRRRLWVTVRLLDLQVAIRTGTSYVSQEGYDAEAPLDLNDAELGLTDSGWQPEFQSLAQRELTTDSTFQVKLAATLDELIRAVNAVNSPTRPPLHYPRVQSWDASLRQRLLEAEKALSPDLPGQRGQFDAKYQMQIDFFRVLVHRVLLGLHHHYVSNPRFHQFPASTEAVHQSSIELLRIQARWSGTTFAAARVPPSSSSSSSSVGAALSISSLPHDLMSVGHEQVVVVGGHRPQPSFRPHHHEWLLDVCRDTFGAALLYSVLFAHRRRNFDNAGRRRNPPLPSLPAETYRTVQQSVNIFKSRTARSVSHFHQYVRVALANTCLVGLAGDTPLAPVLLSVADDIEQTIMAGRQGMWSERAQPFLGEVHFGGDAFLFEGG